MNNPQLEIDYPYSSIQFLENLPAYNCNTGADSLLDLMREIQESGNYYYQGLVFPSLDTVPIVGGGVTINGTTIIPPGSYVTAISAYSSSSAGFNLKIFDKGSKASVYYGDYAFHRVVSGRFGTGTAAEDVPVGPALLKSPFIITGPGVLGWEIVNRSPDDNTIQVLLDCAVPITARSILNKIVSRG